MGNLEEKCLRFVLHYYQKNKLDTQKALKDFKDKHQISACNKNTVRFWWVFTGVAAAIFIVIFMQYRFYEEKEWTEVTADSHSVVYLLPDSSSVILFPHSSIRFYSESFRLSCREVQMRGRVSFSVKHDISRPFTVKGELSQVKVLGTCFTIDESRIDTAFIRVDSGIVQFSVIGQPDTLILTEGMTVEAVKGQHKLQVMKRSMTGNFVFDNTPLSVVLDELSRYYKVQLTVDYPNKRLTADFKAKSLDEIIEIIEKVLNVNIEKVK